MAKAHPDDDEHEDIDHSVLETLKARVDECMHITEFIGEFKNAFQKHIHDFEQQSQEQEDVVEETRNEIDELKKNMKETIETMTSHHCELVHSLKALKETFDKETYDRFAQAEEIQNRIDDILVERGDSRAGKWETSKWEPSKLVGGEERMIEQIKSHVQDSMRSHLEQQAKFEREIHERLAQQDGMRKSVNETQGLQDLCTRVSTWENRLSDLENLNTGNQGASNESAGFDIMDQRLMDQIKIQVRDATRNFSKDSQNDLTDKRVRDQIQIQVQSAMGSHREQQAEFEKRFKDSYDTQQADWQRRLFTSSSTIDSLAAEIEARLKSHESRVRKISDDVTSHMQEAARSHRGRTEELEEQQARLQTTVLQQLGDAKLQHKEQLAEATSSMRGELNGVKSQLSSICSESVVDEIKAEVASLAKSVHEVASLAQSVQQSESGSVNKQEFESEKRNLWEAVMQLQVKQIKESKQKASDALAGFPDVVPSDTTIISGPDSADIARRMARIIRDPSAEPTVARNVNQTRVEPIVDRSLLESEPTVCKSFPGISISSPDGTSRLQPTLRTSSPPRAARVIRQDPSPLHTSQLNRSAVTRSAPASPARGRSAVASPAREDRSRVTPTREGSLQPSYQPPPRVAPLMTTVPRVMPSYQPPPASLEGVSTVPRVMTSYQPPLQPLEGVSTMPRVVVRQASLPGSVGDRGAGAGALPSYTISGVQGS